MEATTNTASAAKAVGPGAATPARSQLKIVALYRQRARERLAKARQTSAHHRQAVIDEGLLWRHFANDWARKARGAV